MFTHTRIAAAALLVGALACAGCSSSSDPASAETCSELGDMGVEIMQDYVDTLESEDVTIEDLESTDSPVNEEKFAEVLSTADALEQRWDELSCDGEPWDAAIERADELTYTKRIGEYVVDEFSNSA